MGSPVVPVAKVKTQALFCPNCGGPIQLRGFAHTLTAVCQQCLSVLDTTTPALRILQTAQANMRRTPKIPLGSRGKFGGTLYEAIGFQTRATDVDGTTYEWDEYVLFNPFKGFQYLSEYQGHWNFIKPLRLLPRVQKAQRPVAFLGTQPYKHFQRSVAETIFVLGEFPWRVHVGDTATLDDYIAPPYVLSSEWTAEEVTWSLGEYMLGQDVWNALGLKDAPPRPVGVYLNQPDPNPKGAASLWKLFGLFLVGLMVLGLFFLALSQNAKVLDERHHFVPGQTGEQSFVTPQFELKGHESNVEVKTKTDLANGWLYVNYALINADTGHAFDFGREVSYYKDGSDTEGSQTDTVTVPSVPPGRYYLRVEPEGDAKNPPVEYDIVVRRDVPSLLYFLLAAIALVIPPIASGRHGSRFEYLRWQESDYAGGSSSSSSGDD